MDRRIGHFTSEKPPTLKARIRDLKPATVTNFQVEQQNRIQRTDYRGGANLRRFERPPEGTCAVMPCRERAAMWIGRSEVNRQGTAVTVAVGVCKAHYDAYQAGTLTERDALDALGGDAHTGGLAG